jgi:haloalkane dehalogenase
MSDVVKAEYRRPFLNPGEDRRPTLSWPRQIPIAGEPADVVEAVRDYSRWLATSRVPKLYFHAIPGALDHSPSQVAFCRTFSNQEEIQVEGVHYLSEEAPGGCRSGRGRLCPPTSRHRINSSPVLEAQQSSPSA